MTKSLDPFRFLLIALSGWMNQQQLQLIDYLRGARAEDNLEGVPEAIIVAADFFPIEAWTQPGLQRFVILFFLQLSSQRLAARPARQAACQFDSCGYLPSH